MNENQLLLRRQRAELTQGISDRTIYRKCLELLPQTEGPQNWLDFGSGQGELLTLLHARFPQARLTGVDILGRPPKLPETVEWIQHDLNERLPLGDHSFDCLVSTEVIEHLENPRAVVREWSRLLRPGGVLLLTTPNQESLRAYCGLIFGGHFTAFLGPSYPAHISALLRLDLVRILQESDFEPPLFDYTNCGGIPRLPSVLWQQISFGLLKGRWWSDNVLALSQKKL